MANKKIIKKQSPKRYDLGDFVIRNQQNINSGFTGAASLGAMTGNDTIAGAASGLASGAALGTAVMPGIGTAIGAVGGAIFGGIFGGKKAAAKRKEARRQEGLRRNLVYDQFESDINTVNENPYGVYEDGGDVNPNIINIEKDELQIDPNNGKILRKYTGINPETGGKYEAHSKKGQDTINNMVTAKEGTFIITKKDAKKYEDAVKNNDKLAQNTIMSNIRNKKQQMTKYADGGDIDYNRFNPQLSPMVTLNNLVPNINGVSNRPYTPSSLTRMNLDTNSSYTSPKTNNTLNSIGSNLLEYLPIAANAIQSFKTPNYLPSRGISPSVSNRQQVLNNLPSQISVNPVLNSISGNSSATNRAILQNTSNPAIARALIQANNDSTNRSINDAYYQNNNLNNSIKAQRAGIYSNLAQSQESLNAQNTQIQLGLDADARQRDLAKQEQLNYALSQLSQLSQAKKTNKLKNQREQQTLDLLREIFPNAGYIFDQYKGGKNGK